MDSQRAGEKLGFHNLPIYLLSDIGFAYRSHGTKIIRFFSCFLAQKETKLNYLLNKLGDKISTFWLDLAMLPPLRKIVRRELCQQHVRPKYIIYSLIDTLECGHKQDNYLFNGLLDLINPYTDSPVVRAKRHRCRPCMNLLAKKKPQSVPLPAVAKAA